VRQLLENVNTSYLHNLMAVCIVMECFFRYTTLLIDNCFDGQTNQIHKKTANVYNLSEKSISKKKYKYYKNSTNILYLG
jgi:hypothetical protein